MTGLEAALSCGGLQHKAGTWPAGGYGVGWWGGAASATAYSTASPAACSPHSRLLPLSPCLSDLIAVPQDDMKTAGFQYASGLLLDLSFAFGSIQVDEAKNALVYGPGVRQGREVPVMSGSGVAAGLVDQLRRRDRSHRAQA